MPRNPHKRIKKLEQQLLRMYPAYMALLQEQARRDAERRAVAGDATSGLKGAIAEESSRRLN